MKKIYYKQYYPQDENLHFCFMKIQFLTNQVKIRINSQQFWAWHAMKNEK